MKATIEWTGESSFSAVADSGHRIQMDGPPDHGGQNKGPRPMELLLMGTGGCTAFDVMMILKKGRQDIFDCRVEIEAERADSEPKVFTKIHIHFVLTGKNIDSKRVARAIELSAEKYCSASIMLAKTAAITHDYEILEVTN